MAPPAERPQSHDEIVQLIYDAGDVPDGLRDAFTVLNAHLNAIGGHALVIQNGVELVEHVFQGPATEAVFSELFTYWRDQDPRFPVASARPGQVLSDMMALDRDAFERSAIFNEYLSKHDVYSSAFGIFPAGPGLVLAQAFSRSRRQGGFGAREIEKVTAWMPHLRRTMWLRHLLRTMQSEIHDLRRALDLLPSAVAVLEPSGHVVCANESAEALFREPGGILTEQGRLTSSSPAERQQLAGAIARIALLADAGARRPTSGASTPTLAVGLPDGTTLSVVLLPLRPRNTLRVEGSRRVRILAVIHDPRRTIRLKPALLASLYGLTPTEAALASALAQGETIVEWAQERGCSEQTARTHVKRVLDKVGVKRQADLVRVLLAGMTMHTLG